MSRPEYYQKNKDKWKLYRQNKVSKYPLYTIWHGILVRTGVRPGAKDHEVRDYINRNITVCDEWKDYKTFETWAFNNGYAKDLVLDRIDNDSGYRPDNCRFTTRSQNQRNRRITRYVMIDGVRTKLIDAYEKAKCEIPYKQFLSRITRGWDFYDAVSIPLKKLKAA